MSRKSIVAVVAGCALGTSAAHAVLFQPDSATASSWHSEPYDIENVIDGSGLPMGFGPGDAHDEYLQHNHWTTDGTAPSDEWARFIFDTPKTIGAFYLWNHRSTVPFASNSEYEVLRFDLRLYNAVGSLLFTLDDADALPETATAQVYRFTPVADVSRVDFQIEHTQQDKVGRTNDAYTGLAEVAFAVPEPGSVVMLAAAGLASLLERRRS